MKMYLVKGYKDNTIRAGFLEREWVSKSGKPLVTLKILDHYREHKTVFRTYHRDKLAVMKILNVEDALIADTKED
mgnify:FL=1